MIKGGPQSGNRFSEVSFSKQGDYRHRLAALALSREIYFAHVFTRFPLNLIFWNKKGAPYWGSLLLFMEFVNCLIGDLVNIQITA